jgi:hypothetical protein
MYEKCNELDLSLNDILVVLTMDPHHLKARIRRGRIYEAQVRVCLTSLICLKQDEGFDSTKCNRICDRNAHRESEKFTPLLA